MKFIDSAGNELTEGTPVSMPLTFGQAVPGTIKEIKSGLGLGSDGSPQLCVLFVIPLAAQPNGIVPGVFAMPRPKPDALIQA
jgi:hypothetical protein